MKPTQLKQKQTPNNLLPALSDKANDNQDSRYDYLMLLTNDWTASQNHSNDFIRSVN